MGFREIKHLGMLSNNKKDLLLEFFFQLVNQKQHFYTNYLH